MAGALEPHRDQRTIGSFKRTCNAAVLLWVANRNTTTTQTVTRTATLAAAITWWLLGGPHPNP